MRYANSNTVLTLFKINVIVICVTLVCANESTYFYFISRRYLHCFTLREVKQTLKGENDQTMVC